MVECRVGDWVKLRSWTSMANEYGVDSEGDIFIPRGFGASDYFFLINKALCGEYVGTICWVRGDYFKVRPNSPYFFKESIDPRYLDGGDDTNV